MRKSPILAAACLFLAGPADANFVTEPTFREKMEGSSLVVIGTVTAVDRGRGRDHWGSTATLALQQRLKGESPDTITVETWSRIAELDPRCCEVDATYLMFLIASPNGQLFSFRGLYGMVRIGGPPRTVTVLPNLDDD